MKKRSNINLGGFSGASWGFLGASWRRLGGALALLGGLLVSWSRPGRVLGASWGVLVGNMAPTWLPKRSPNASKIEAKINQFLNASWNRFLKDFGRLWKAKWRQVGIEMASKIDANFERRIIKKLMFS